MDEYLTKTTKAMQYRQKRRRRAIEKLAQEKKPSCSICGCPHKEILQIGHIEHRDGRFHRRKLSGNSKGSQSVVNWVLKTPVEEALERVQLECPYCNAWHNRFKDYPPQEKRPKWGDGEE